MKANRLQRVLLSVVLLGLAAPLFAESARGLVRRGNKAYGAGRYDEAMKAYEQADVERPESPVVMFNQGAVHYRAEDYVAARESFEKAAKASRDPAFEANCRYNVGDTWFKEARRQMDSDLKKAVEACERSVDNYQAALALRPELEAARRNIEIVRRLWKSILDEQKKRQEQQKAQQEEQQKFAEEMKQLIERQEKAVGQSAELGKKQESAGASQAVQDQSSVQAKDQRQLGQDTQAAADQLTQMLSQAPPPPAGGTPAGAPPAGHPAQEQMQQARQLQDQAASKLDQTQPKPASADQKQAAEALRKALESLSKPPEDQKQEGQKQDQKQDPQQDGQKQDQKGQEEQKQDQGKEGQKQEGQEQQKQDGEKQQQAAAKEGGKEQQDQDQKQVKARLADQDARNILDDEKRNRERRTAAEQQGVAPVDKDW